MEQKPNPDSQYSDDEDNDSRNSEVGCPGLGLKRPTEQELKDALIAYRRDLTNKESHSALLVLLYRSVAVQARKLIFIRFNTLIDREDELVLRTLKRIEAEEIGKVDEGVDTLDLEQEENVRNSDKKNAKPQLLANYEFRHVGRSIYNYVQHKTLNIARNMEENLYVSKGGFWSNALIERFKALQLAKTGQKALRSGTRIEVPIILNEGDDDSDAYIGAVPAGLRTSETPMRESLLRVKSLTQRLNTIAKDMIGKSVSYIDDKGKECAGRLAEKHVLVWEAWLGLSNVTYLDLSEEELADSLGIARSTVKRHILRTHSFMLQHPNLRTILALMEPNRIQSGDSTPQELNAKLDALEAVLRSPRGRGFFRTLVHQWLTDHA